MKSKILVVEDDITLLELLEYNLVRHGYEVLTVGDGRSAIAVASEEIPNLLILAVMLPDIEEFEVCRLLRTDHSFPILMLTARTNEIDKVLGLEMGADDYLTKPFSMRELIARIKALLRSIDRIQEAPGHPPKEKPTIGAPDSERILLFCNLEIDLIRCELRLNDKPVHLKPNEFDLLSFVSSRSSCPASTSCITMTAA
jgi:DNA-binding response OmpR family regulator